MHFKCSICGEIHDVAALTWNFAEPAPWLAASEAERERSYLTPDQCELVANDAVHYFIRAQLEIPIRGTDKIFTWGVWCSLSEESHMEMSHYWQDPARTKLGPYFGWLCNKVPFYPDSLFLKTHVHQRAVGLRPWVELEPTSHPLALDQKQGMDPAKLQEFHSRLLHEHNT